MQCLRCNVIMKKILLNGVVVVDYCEGCGSFWLDKHEFENAINTKHVDTQLLAKKAKEESMIEKHRIFYDEFCPKCSIGTIHISEKNGIKIDRCNECGGMFFDKGELASCFKKQESWFKRVLKIFNWRKD